MPLNNRQEAFCEAYVRLRVGAKAAIEAGYSPKPNSARKIASELLTHPDILARVKEIDAERREQIEAAIRNQAARALKTLVDIMDGIHSERAPKGGMAAVQAANSILDRSGLKPIEKLEHAGPGGAPIPVQSVFAVPTPAPDADTWALEHAPK